MQAEELLGAERRRIGEKLHSGAAQSLSHALFLLNLYQQKGEREDLEGARQAIRMAIHEIRYAIAELRDEERWPLIPSLRDSISEFKRKVQIPIHFSVEGNDSNVSPSAAHYILTFVQEGLTNIAKHAKASSCTIKLQISDRFIKVSMQDNGVGIHSKTMREKVPHFGLKFMKERALELGGEIQISGNGQGTLLSAIIPLGASHG